MFVLSGCGSRKGTVSVTQTDTAATRSLTVAVAAVTETIEPVAAPKEASSTTGLDSSRVETSLASSLAWIDKAGVMHHSIANKDTIPGALVRRETVMMATQADTARAVQQSRITITDPKPGWWQRRLNDLGHVTAVALVLLIIWFLFRDSFKPPDLS